VVATPSLSKWGISAAIVSPLLSENQFDARFKAFGLQALVSFPLSELKPGTMLYAEGGFGTMSSKLQPATRPGFNHTYFDFPLRLRLLHPFNEKGLTGEAYVGAVLRFFQYNDDVGLLGGPLYKVESGLFQPDFAVGLSLPISENLRARLLTGFVYLTIGVEMTFDKKP
jgi:hypothetical protein